MLPSSLIFSEAAETATAREQAHMTALRLVAFVLIGIGVAAFYAGLEPAFVSAFPEIAPLELDLLVFASLLVPAYQLHRRFCFPSEMPHLRAAMRYTAVQLGVLCLAGFFSQLAHGVVGLPHLTTLLLVFGLTAGVNFSLLRTWAFSSL